MFKLFKQKKHDFHNIYSIVDGVSFPLDEVDDDVFSQKIMGEGVAIIPTHRMITAPCSGQITTLFPTGHAFGITREDGVEILVHIGLETVQLKGNGFKILKQKNQYVHVGDAIIEVNLDLFHQKKIDPTIMVVFLDLKDKCLQIETYGEVLKGKSVIACTTDKG